MSDRCFNTLQEQNNKTHISNVYYNYMKISALSRIQTQGDSIPVEQTNHSPKSHGGLTNTKYAIMRQFA